MAPRMAQQSTNDLAYRGLKIDTQSDERSHRTSSDHRKSQRPILYASADSQETIKRSCATPPIEIPGQHDAQDDSNSALLLQPETMVDQYLKDRQTTISFDNEVKLSSGHRHSILDPLKKSTQNELRGRSFAQALSEYRSSRPHSESDRNHFDPVTGRHLPEYSRSPPHDEAHVGEARFPLLQPTVDALARREMQSPPHTMSLTSASTISPVEEAVLTPNDENVSSPVDIGIPIMRKLSTSYESSPRQRTQRKASERWRDGQNAPDFFSKAGSLKRSDRDPTRRVSRRDTGSTRSPRSAASSFLQGFSLPSSAGEDIPPSCDAEGATVGEDYVLGKQIGYGGFSIIREVKQMSAQTGTQRTLAVKIVKKQIDGKTKAENDAAQAEFEHEIDLWRLLNHKHILPLEAVYELKEATFCFVPLNVGGTLFDLISNNRQGLAPDLAANYAYQLASALRYLHLDARVVHRDVKLENILVDTTTTHGSTSSLLRVCDFGLAEWMSSDNDSMTSSFSDTERDRPLRRYFGPADSSTSAFAGGSLEYAAPEILRIATTSSGDVQAGDIPPEKSIVSPAVDIWAMGVCIFALLMGRRPFQDSFQPRVVMAILAAEWDKHGLKDKAGEMAYKLVRGCLTKDPTRRPGIGDVHGHPWFEEARNALEGSDAESESARASGWRL